MRIRENRFLTGKRRLPSTRGVKKRWIALGRNHRFLSMCCPHALAHAALACRPRSLAPPCSRAAALVRQPRSSAPLLSPAPPRLPVGRACLRWLRSHAGYARPRRACSCALAVLTCRQRSLALAVLARTAALPPPRSRACCLPPLLFVW